MIDSNADAVPNVRLLVWELQTGLGLATIQIPKVRAKSGDFLLFLGTTIGEKNKITGSHTTLAVSGGDLPPESSVALLGAQEHERAQLPAKVSSGQGETGAA